MAKDNETDLPSDLPAEVLEDLMGLIGAIGETSPESQAAAHAELTVEPRVARSPAPKPATSASKQRDTTPTVKPKSKPAPQRSKVKPASVSTSAFSDMAAEDTIPSSSPRSTPTAPNEPRADVEPAAASGATKVEPVEVESAEVDLVDLVDLVDPIVTDPGPVVSIDLRDGAELPASDIEVEFDILSEASSEALFPLPEPVPDDFGDSWFRYNWPFVLAALFIALGVALIFLVLTSG